MLGYRLAWAVTVGALIGGLCGTAQAQQGNTINGIRPEVHGAIHWKVHLGAGFRLDIPIVPDGFIDGVVDEFAISPGFDLFFLTDDGADDFWFVVPVPAQWNFYLTPDWSVFPELGLGLGYGFWNRRQDRIRLHAVFTLGARYHFNARNSLVMRLTWPGGLQVGVSF